MTRQALGHRFVFSPHRSTLYVGKYSTSLYASPSLVHDGVTVVVSKTYRGEFFRDRVWPGFQLPCWILRLKFCSEHTIANKSEYFCLCVMHLLISNSLRPHCTGAVFWLQTTTWTACSEPGWSPCLDWSKGFVGGGKYSVYQFQYGRARSLLVRFLATFNIFISD